MDILKWHPEERRYHPHEIPDDWNVKLISDDMDEIVNCVCCGKEVPYGMTYTSRRFHTPMGMGFPECEECYERHFTEDEIGY